MKEELIKFETAKLAKEKGFCIKYNCCQLFFTDNKNGVYENEPKIVPFEHHTWILAPTQSLLKKWLRVEHKLDVIVSVVYTGDGKRYHCDLFTTYMSSLPSIFDTYEEAFEEGLQEALKLI